MTAVKKSLLEKPAGPTELGKGFKGCWNNRHMGTDGPILCEICGTEHPERKDESYIVSRFLNKQVVEECCGAIIDCVYREFAEEFAEAFLIEFAENPTNIRFHLFVQHLQNCLSKAEKNIGDVHKHVVLSQQKISSIKVSHLLQKLIKEMSKKI